MYRRRKVRCDETRPLCGHCQRLRLDCRWNDRRTKSASAWDFDEANEASNNAAPSVSEGRDGSIGTCIERPSHEFAAAPQAMIDLDLNEVFDYASFMWDGSGIGYPLPQTGGQTELNQTSDGGTIDGFNDSAELMTWPSPSAVPLSESALLDLFSRSNAPPILVTVESNLRWSTIRKLFASMASTSAMVRHAVLAFSSLRQLGVGNHDTQSRLYYEKSKNALIEMLEKRKQDVKDFDNSQVTYALAVLFVLVYVDLVTDRAIQAHANLKEAHTLVKGLDHDTMSFSQERMVSWLRLLDAKAVSAGGDGLFLADELANFNGTNLGTPLEPDDADSQDEDDVHDVLLDTLLSPGFAFFHKVQSFMGRISLIDPWHRKRGTVEDETHVMNIASKINSDILRLYRQRPPLMDLAADGRLKFPHLPTDLATNVTRNMRTYLSNYHASFIHLHRVAYKHLPRTKNMNKAIRTIGQMARQMCDDANAVDDALPINMLWPLLMWGCEEDSIEERTWIVSNIRRMGTAATNASITADVLEEVQRRQDALGHRVDVRSVMEDVFQTSFAIV
jgi:hypothetical protein